MSLPEERNIAAQRLIARGRLRDALDLLNDAIRMAPQYGHSYLTRAQIFDRMGMAPQAAADRAKAQQMGVTAPLQPPAPHSGGRPPRVQRRPTPPPAAAAAPPPAGPQATAPPPPAKSATQRAGGLPSPETSARTPPAVRPPKAADAPRREPRSLSRAAVPLMLTVGVLALGIGGLFLGLQVIDDITSSEGSSQPDDGLGAGESPSVTEAPTATPEPTAPPAALEGSPFSFSNLESAWEAKGITATPGEAETGIAGMRRTPVTVTLEKDAVTMTVALLVYSGPQQVSEDWDLQSGRAPVPKAGRTVPASPSIWWNQNVVVVVLEDSGALGRDPLQAFLDLAP